MDLETELPFELGRRKLKVGYLFHMNFLIKFNVSNTLVFFQEHIIYKPKNKLNS